MSDNADLVLRLRAGFGGPDAGVRARGERLIEVISPFAVPELRSRLAGGAITTDYVGIDDLRAGWEDFLSAFESVRIEFEELVETGDSVVDMVKVIGVPKDTELEIQQSAAAMFEFERGRLIRVEFHLDRDEALRRAS